MAKADEKNINQSLYDGLELLRMMMSKASGFSGCTIAEIQDWMDGLDYQKAYRILKTAQACGFVESEDNKTWRLGKDLVYLSHRYLQSLAAEHKRIEKMVVEFSIPTF